MDMTSDEKRFLGMPYDWSRPTWKRFKMRLWNPDYHRVFTPKVYGLGWTINFYELGRRLGLNR